MKCEQWEHEQLIKNEIHREVKTKWSQTHSSQMRNGGQKNKDKTTKQNNEFTAGHGEAFGSKDTK